MLFIILLKKNILIVDDSIVRGNTIAHIINLLRLNNVGKIFVASASPEIVNCNRYGLDIPNKYDLISYNTLCIEKEIKCRKSNIYGFTRFKKIYTIF